MASQFHNIRMAFASFQDPLLKLVQNQIVRQNRFYYVIFLLLCLRKCTLEDGFVEPETMHSGNSGLHKFQLFDGFFNRNVAGFVLDRLLPWDRQQKGCLGSIRSRPHFLIAEIWPNRQVMKNSEENSISIKPWGMFYFLWTSWRSCRFKLMQDCVRPLQPKGHQYREKAPLERGASKSSLQCIVKWASASNCPKNEPFCSMYTVPMFSRWRSDCYGFLLR